MTISTSLLVSILFAFLIMGICLWLLYREVRFIREMLNTIADLIAFDYSEEKEREKE